jgi:pyruvate/2-oxoglutarate/acetoin dehydrogenase E1 component
MLDKGETLSLEASKASKHFSSTIMGTIVFSAPIVSIYLDIKPCNYLNEEIANGSVEIINPRYLIPFDYEFLDKSIKKTKRLLIVEDGIMAGGIGEGILAHIVDIPRIKFFVQHKILGKLVIY